MLCLCLGVLGQGWGVPGRATGYPLLGGLSMEESHVVFPKQTPPDPKQNQITTLELQ